MASGDNNNASATSKEEEEIDEAQVRRLGEETVDDVIQRATRDLNTSSSTEENDLSAEADALKEHDVADEEATEAARLEAELAKELKETGGWVKILGNDELMKKVIQAGAPNQNPMRGDMCKLRVEGRLADDETVVFQPDEVVEIQLGDSEVIPGLDLTIPLMTRGEIATVKVSSRFGYGSKGDLPTVPPNSNLVFRVELLHSEAEQDLAELSVSQRRNIGNRKRVRGNFWYGRGEASLAVNCYRRALEFLDEVEGGIQFPGAGGSSSSSDITPEVRQLFDDRLTTLNNLAMAQLKLQSYEPALTSVEAVLKCQPNNVKALFRKGKILGAKGDTEEALTILNKAKNLEPDDASIAAEIAKLSQRRVKEHQSEKQLYKRMFKKDSSKSEDGGGDSSSGGGAGGRSKVLSSLTMGVMLSGAAICVAGVMAYRYNHRFL